MVKVHQRARLSRPLIHNGYVSVNETDHPAGFRGLRMHCVLPDYFPKLPGRSAKDSRIDGIDVVIDDLSSIVGQTADTVIPVLFVSLNWSPAALGVFGVRFLPC